uniref:C-type lectin domain-containing protein n=1 Tax=Plectus sambesii TaxID=2011161 RepID=A0A914UV75_9BILA
MLVQSVAFIFLALLGVNYAGSSLDPAGCSDGFLEKHDGVCYRFEYIRATWADAKKTCENYGANLISIRDIKLSTWLKEPSIAGTTAFWFGLHKDENGRMRWADKPHKFDTEGFSDWASGEPNFSTGSCVSMFTPLAESGLKLKTAWKMTDCEQNLPYICTMPAATAKTNAVLA